MAINLTPLSNRIIIKQTEEVKDKTDAGLLLPDAAPETTGEVIAIGQGFWEAGKLTPIDFEVGDTVLFGVFSGERVKWNDEEVIFMRDVDVLAVLA